MNGARPKAIASVSEVLELLRCLNEPAQAGNGDHGLANSQLPAWTGRDISQADHVAGAGACEPGEIYLQLN